MPRIRSLKPEHRQHRKIGPLSHFDYRLWVGLLFEVDDAGRMVYDPLQVRASVFPYYRNLKVEAVVLGVVRLAELGLVRVYQVAGVKYLEFPSWLDHQKIDHPTGSKLPPYHPENDVSRGLANPREVSRLSARAGADRSEGSDLIGSDRIDGTLARARELPAPTPIGFNLDPIFFETLDQLPRFKEHPKLRDPAWWQAMILAYPHIDHIEELKKAHGWLVTKAKGKLRRDMAGFMRNWFEREEKDPGEVM